MERVLTVKANALSALSGCEVHIIAYGLKGRKPYFPLEPAVMVHDLGINERIRPVTFKRKLSKALKAIRPDVTIGLSGAELRFLPDIERILNAIWELRDADGILRTKGVTAKWNFYDWSFEENHLSVSGAEESMLSSLFIIAAKELVKLAEMLAWKFDGKKLAERWKLTASNFERRFIKNGRIEEQLIDIDTKMPKTCSTQLAHAFWLLTGEASPEGRAICEKALVDPSLLMPDYYLHYFWFRAAADAGVQREALSRIRRYWGRCIDTGSPTLYEAGVHTFGKQSMNGAGSLCHGFGTIPVAFLHEVILGVRPLSGGFKEFSFAPDLMDLEFAEGRIAVPQGVIHVRITRNDREITIPTGCSAILPDGRKLGCGRHQLH